MTYQPFPPLSSDNATPTRDEIETAIERLIDLLDAVDPDPDLEDNGDAEPTLGAAETRNAQSQMGWASGSSQWDECEEENEHGGDILDEPHDDLDQGDAEPFLGWPEACSQGPRIGLDDASIAFDANDTDMIRVGRDPEFLDFSGTGYREGRRLLDELRRRRPDIQQSFVSINPALWR